MTAMLALLLLLLMMMMMMMMISRKHTTQSAMRARSNRTLFCLEHGFFPLQHAPPLYMLNPLFAAHLSINTLGQG